VPVAVTGGQAAAHSPVQALFFPESSPNMYTVRPCESTRMLPWLLWPTASVGWVGAGRAAGFGGAVDRGAADELVSLEPHPARAMSRMAAALANSVVVVVRLVMGDSLST
jgi:hypothetical protein